MKHYFILYTESHWHALDTHYLTYRTKKCAGIGGHVPDKAAGDEREGKFCRKFGNRKATSKEAKGKDKHVLSKCIVAFMLKALPACTNFTVAMHSSTFAAIARLD